MAQHLGLSHMTVVLSLLLAPMSWRYLTDAWLRALVLRDVHLAYEASAVPSSVHSPRLEASISTMTVSTIPLTLDLTLGAANIGTLVATLLFGMFLIQLYIYALSCTSDRPWLKLLITAAGFISCYFKTHACNDYVHRFLEAMHTVRGAILTTL
jgi:hypothetical protein